MANYNVLPDARSSGAGGEVNTNRRTENGILGIFGGRSQSKADFPPEKFRKIQQLAQHLLHQQNVLMRYMTRFVG